MVGSTSRIGKVSLYSAYKKSALVDLCHRIGIKNTTAFTRDKLINIIEASGEDMPTARECDLLSHLKPYAGIIAESQKNNYAEKEYIDRIRNSVLEMLGNSISRLPCLAFKAEISTRDLLAIKANISALDGLHAFFKTKRICNPGEIIVYDSCFHDGPEELEQGEKCMPVSTGIASEEKIILKAIVTRVNQ